jgi:membrane complex biogenesis BtpA family protein
VNHLELRGKRVRAVAALHLPPTRSAASPNGWPLTEIVAYALKNASIALEGGVDALYMQDLGDRPVAPEVQPHTIARMTAVGRALRQLYPDAPLGVCLMSHGAKGPLAVAEAMDGDFVRLKVYVGAMVKAEGILQGCAHEAVAYRATVRGEHIAILADIYDRTGVALAPTALGEAARQAVTFGRADGLVLTGRRFDESMAMVAQVREANLSVPLLIGGGVSQETVAEALRVADGVVVSTALKRISGWNQVALSSDWDAAKVGAFVAAARKA